MRDLLRGRRSAARRPAPARAGRHGAAAIAAASRIRRSRMRRAAGGCLWERRRLEKWERTGQVESRGRGENCRKRQKRLYCSKKVRFGGVFLLTCRLFSRKNSFPKSGPLLKGLVSRFAPQSALLAPSSATAAAFNSPDSSPTPQNAALRTKCI